MGVADNLSGNKRTFSVHKCVCSECVLCVCAVCTVCVYCVCVVSVYLALSPSIKNALESTDCQIRESVLINFTITLL